LAGNFFFFLTSLDSPAISDAAEDTDDWEETLAPSSSLWAVPGAS
jgi:hypothetical protein